MGQADEGNFAEIVDHNLDWDSTYDTCLMEYSNRFWYGAKAYVGNSTDITDSSMEFCGYVSSENLVTKSSSAFEMTEMFRMGDSVICPDTTTPSKYVVIYLAEDDVYPIPCNIGIFACYCTNLKAVREDSVYESESA